MVHEAPLIKEIGMRVLLIVSGVVLVCVCLLSAVKWGGATDDGKVLHTVNCYDIPKTVKLIGRFGVPLGEEVVTIRGKWKEGPEPTKASDFNFVVTTVNGKAIQTPIEIHWSSMEPLRLHGSIVVDSDGGRKWVAGWDATDRERLPKAFDGDEWEMMGYEAGHMAGWPREINKMYKHVQQIYSPGTFVTMFRFVTVRVFGKPHEKSETGGYTILNNETEEYEDSSESDAPVQGTGSGMF